MGHKINLSLGCLKKIALCERADFPPCCVFHAFVLVYGYLYCTHHLMDLFHLGVVINEDIQALSFAYHPNCMSAQKRTRERDCPSIEQIYGRALARFSLTFISPS